MENAVFAGEQDVMMMSETQSANSQMYRCHGRQYKSMTGVHYCLGMYLAETMRFILPGATKQCFRLHSFYLK